MNRTTVEAVRNGIWQLKGFLILTEHDLSEFTDVLEGSRDYRSCSLFVQHLENDMLHISQWLDAISRDLHRASLRGEAQRG